MTTVITYGTYDHLHRGHVRLLERAKALGDYLIVGVTSDDFDKQRGKINVQQPLEERVAAVRATELADKIIVEEYEGQKIDDIKRYGVDVFTVGSDWVGHFDYLNEYCKVTYLERTQGVSSTEIRSSRRLRCGLVGYTDYIDRVYAECALVNGLEVAAVCAEDCSMLGEGPLGAPLVTADYDEMLGAVDAVFVYSHPDRHYGQVRRALEAGKHVMCEAPMAKSAEECDELFALADERGSGADGLAAHRLLHGLRPHAAADRWRAHRRRCVRGRHVHQHEDQQAALRRQARYGVEQHGGVGADGATARVPDTGGQARPRAHDFAVRGGRQDV